jgi:hypothetical protein
MQIFFVYFVTGGHGDVALALSPRRLVVMGHHGWLPTRRGIPRTEVLVFFFFLLHFLPHAVVSHELERILRGYLNQMLHVIDFIFLFLSPLFCFF